MKTISMAMNVRRPGFQLLSLNPAEFRETPEKPTFADAPCLLPDQLHVYLGVYLPLVLLSMLLIFVSNLGYRTRHRHVKTRSDARGNLESTSGRESDPEDVTPTPYTSLSNRHPSTAHYYNKHGLRSPHIAMTFSVQGQRRRVVGTSEAVSGFSCLRRALEDIWPAGISYASSRRRAWISLFIRDVRDIAVFPLGVFVLVTWWVVT